MATPTIAQLQQAISIAEQIEKLQSQLASIVGGSSSAPSAAVFSAFPAKKRGGKRTLSPAARARIAAAQRARWAKAKGQSSTPAAAVSKPGRKKKRKLSPEGRARIVAALKARWAKARSGK